VPRDWHWLPILCQLVTVRFKEQWNNNGSGNNNDERVALAFQAVLALSDEK
jgi:hypothetical protein